MSRNYLISRAFQREANYSKGAGLWQGPLCRFLRDRPYFARYLVIGMVNMTGLLISLRPLSSSAIVPSHHSLRPCAVWVMALPISSAPEPALSCNSARLLGDITSIS